MADRAIKADNIKDEAIKDQSALRRAVLREARGWLGTPYQHQASCKGAGTDCLGLIRGIWRALYGGQEPQGLPAYSPDWAERKGQETLLLAARRWLVPIDNKSALPGDVLIFRMARDAPCKHIAIMSRPEQMIHAYWGRAVCESHIVPYWQNRWAYSFVFPISDQVASL